MTDALRSYSFIADTDSLDALRKLSRGWAAWELAEGDFRVRLRAGGTVRAHVDRAELEPGFEVSCLVADYLPDAEELPSRDSAFTSDGTDVVLFRGVTWLEHRPDLGPDHTIQFSGIPGLQIPDGAVVKCDFTDAVALVAEEGALVVRLALRPGWLEVVEDAEEISKFFALRGYR